MNALQALEVNSPPPAVSRYVDAVRLGPALWEPGCAPSLRSIREWQKLGVIPHVKVGGRVFFDPAAVKAALENRRTRKAKAA
jgi:hypothetical protein